MTVLDTTPAQAPDRDWETLRAAAMAVLATRAPGWTDHNVSDPGVTIAEAVAWGLSDLHYRIQYAPLDGWSAESGLWRGTSDRHWTGVPLPGDHPRLRVLARELEMLSAEDVAAVRRAVTPVEAAGILAAAEVPADVAPAAARLLRAPYVLRAALDGGAVVDTVAEYGEDLALATLRVDPAFDRLWDEELRAIRRRARRRHAAREIRRRADELRRLVGDAPTRAAAEDAVTAALGDDIDAGQVRDVLGLHPAPPGATPETWETVSGRTTHWPPHPLQARTVEPVTADDYARVARTVPGVRRAWTVPQVLPGIGWDGRIVANPATRPGAVTLLVEAEEGVVAPGPGLTPTEFLKQVLRTAVGPEVDVPYTRLGDDLTPAMPRRMICDEVGAALLDRCAVTLRGVLHVAASADRDEVRAKALDRVERLLDEGRPESAPEAEPVREYPRDLDGPWPPPPPMPGGWTPGEAVRLTEVVRALSDDPEVYGVEDLAASVDGVQWEPAVLPVDPGCVPYLAREQCVRVQLDLVEGCGGAC